MKTQNRFCSEFPRAYMLIEENVFYLCTVGMLLCEPKASAKFIGLTGSGFHKVCHLRKNG